MNITLDLYHHRNCDYMFDYYRSHWQMLIVIDHHRHHDSYILYLNYRVSKFDNKQVSERVSC